MSLVENLNLINQYKGDIKQAIIDKGVDMNNVPLSGYANKIGEISGKEEILDWGFDMIPYADESITGDNVWNYNGKSYFTYQTFDPVTGGNVAYHKKLNNGDWIFTTFGGETQPQTGATIWTDGVNVYSNYIYFNVQAGYTTENISLVLNGSTWERKVWNVDIQSAFSIWKTPDGKIYYTGKVGSAMDWSSPTVSYELVNGEWIERNFTGNVPQSGDMIWDDGVNVYATNFSQRPTGEVLNYSLMLQGNNWVFKDWGDVWINGNDVFKLGDDIFHNDGLLGHNYKLVDGNWIPFDFDGVVQSGHNIWSDGTYFYHNYNAVAVIKDRAVRKLNVSKNGEYNADGFVGWDSVNVNITPKVQFRQFFENGFYDAQQEGLDGYQAVEVNVIPRIGYVEITENGEYNVNPEEYDGYGTVVVNVPSSEGYTSDDIIEGKYNPVNVTGNASKVGNHMFYHNDIIETVDLPNCATIGGSAFYTCSKLTTVDLPNCMTVQSSAFYSCSKLTTVNIPNCYSIYSGGFQYCSNLTKVNCEKIEGLGLNAFNGCSKLSEISLPICKFLHQNVFLNCKSLTSLDFPRVSFISTAAFSGCTNLQTISFGSTSVCKLSNSNAFSGCTALTSIYVPASLVDSYKTAANWSYFASKIVPIA